MGKKAVQQYAQNAALTKSIWGKWLDSKIKEIDLNAVTLRVFKDALPEGVYNVAKDSEVDNEVWGEISGSGSGSDFVRQTKIYRIRYGVEGFYVNDGKVPIPYEQIDKWRRGTILNFKF